MIFNAYFETAWNPGMLSIEVMSHSTPVRFLGSSHWMWLRNCKTVSATSSKYLYNLEWATGNPGILSVEVKSHSTSVRFLWYSYWIWLKICKTVSATSLKYLYNLECAAGKAELKSQISSCQDMWNCNLPQNKTKDLLPGWCLPGDSPVISPSFHVAV